MPDSRTHTRSGAPGGRDDPPPGMLATGIIAQDLGAVGHRCPAVKRECPPPSYRAGPTAQPFVLDVPPAQGCVRTDWPSTARGVCCGLRTVGVQADTPADTDTPSVRRYRERSSGWRPLGEEYRRRCAWAIRRSRRSLSWAR